MNVKENLECQNKYHFYVSLLSHF